MFKNLSTRRVSEIALLGMLAVFICGCSLLPRITFDRPNTVPQKTVKTERHYFHKTKDGEVTKLDEQNYNQEERKLTLQERLANFISNLKGWAFIAFVLLAFFCPGLIGWVLGTVFNGFRKALESTVLAIQKAKVTGEDVLKHLSEEHNKDPQVKQLINNIRAKISPRMPNSLSNPQTSPAQPASQTTTVTGSDLPPPVTAQGT